MVKQTVVAIGADAGSAIAGLQGKMKEAMSKAEIESKYFAKSKWKLIRKIVAVTQASSGTSAQTAVKDSLSKDEMIIANGGVEIAKAVQVTYKMW